MSIMPWSIFAAFARRSVHRWFLSRHSCKAGLLCKVCIRLRDQTQRSSTRRRSDALGFDAQGDAPSSVRLDDAAGRRISLGFDAAGFDAAGFDALGFDAQGDAPSSVRFDDAAGRRISLGFDAQRSEERRVGKEC